MNKSSRQYYRDKPNATITDSELFKFRVKIRGETSRNGNTTNVEVAVPLKYLINFCTTLEMPLFNCKINLVLTWSANWVIAVSTGEGKFAITDSKRYVPVVT